MKYFGIFLFILLGLSSCKKSGIIQHRLKFTNATIDEGSGKTSEDSVYTQFGPLVTTLTPYMFKSKLNILAYQDNLESAGSNSSTHMISYIDGHDNDPNYQLYLDVDFSNNQEVTAEPILYGNDLRDGVYEQDEVTMNYFMFMPYYYYQEVELPIGYQNVFLQNLASDAVTYDAGTNRLLLKCNEIRLLDMLYPENLRPSGIVFGGTDSTYIHNPQGLPDVSGCPFAGPICNRPFIRSHRYSPIIVTMPNGGETIEMFSTISFTPDNLIQVYAGSDGLSYTSDDVFVYAPRYWERVVARLEIR
jgi:hypothetical protein